MMMKQDLIFQQKLTQTLQLSMSMKNSLDILKLNQEELLDYIEALVEKNPVIAYKPSTDMHTLLHETLSQTRTLKDDLYMQLHTFPYAYDERICTYLIESLDEHGFLTSTIKEYAQCLQVSEDTIEDHLEILQSFEPCGIAAFDSVDSIRLQLLHKHLFVSEYIFSNYPDDIIEKNYSKIAKSCHLSISEVMEALDHIKNCTPFPCSNYQNTKDPVVLPDFEVKVIGQEIELIPKQPGHFTIEDELAVMKEESEQIKQYFEEAYYFIDNLNKRNKTLMIMANELFHIQKNYFLYHDELQSCTLADIALKTGFHESTVSRTLSNKYYIFENEIYPVKQLFISSTKSGSSKDSILKAIQKFVKEEDKTHPYKDEELVDLLAEIDLYVSRRGVAKYRSLLDIPGSRERRLKY